MYQILKHFIKLLPPSVVYKNELLFRSLYYQFYRGKKYECTICKKQLRKFIELENEDKLCPYCGSLARNRRLWMLLKSSYLRENWHVLHFSPSRSLYRKLKKYPTIKYVSTDYAGDFLADEQLDITNIDKDDSTYDLIICYHILEHIEEDQKAMKELYRVLKKGGYCIIQTPFKNGEIYEDFTIRTPEERLKHFGQADHVRIYSVAGLRDRLENNGFEVEILNFTEKKENRFGLKKYETVLITRKC